ncbi:S8 family peptidase [Oscillospiraceae bacterium HV4-5-C5C]|nr:S8 family peptidase [Oscillospiraceae bacterium HV4-5-C5C]
MDDLRRHLLIPETEVEYIDPTQPRGPKKEDVDHFEHGKVLSSGLQEIVDAYTKVQSAGSLSDEDIRVFEVLLPEGEKFSNKTLRDFLQGEGMKIKNVHDERCATVVTTTSRFNTLRDRVGKYRDGERINKSFRDIDSFRFPDAVDKQSPSLKARFLEAIGAEIFDVEFQEQKLTDELGTNGQMRIEQKLIAEIKQEGGEIRSEPYSLSDDTRIIRAGVSLSSLKKISDDPLVSHVAPTAFYSTAPAYCVPSNSKLSLDPSISLDDLPIVAVLDSGIEFPPELSAVVIEHWTPHGAQPGNKEHGTSVASKVAFANTGIQITNGIMTPRARIIDCNVCGIDPESPDPTIISNPTMIKRIKEAVQKFKDVAKIFNFSSAGRKPIEGDKISNLGYELDVLALKYGVQFVISAGNHELYKTEDSLQSILDDDDARIAAPSDSMLNISVGAIVGQDHAGSLSKRLEVAPYSRIGPGFQGMRKPDIVTYAGTILKSGNAPADDYSMMLGINNQLAFDAGTSFTAPVISGDLAQIATSVPDDNVFLAKALLYHGTIMPIDPGKEKINRDDAAFYGDLYGRGLSDVNASMYSTPDKVTFLHVGTMNKLHKQHVKFLMPQVCDSMDMHKRNRKVKITVTCVTQSPVDKDKGEDYLQAYVSASIYSINGSGKKTNSNPSETDGRKKWDTCFHFEAPYSSFTSGDWEIWLELHTRYEVPDDQDINYSLSITIEDLTKSLKLYDSIRAEARDRFPVVQLVRVPVRI